MTEKTIIKAPYLKCERSHLRAISHDDVLRYQPMQDMIGICRECGGYVTLHLVTRDA